MQIFFVIVVIALCQNWTHKPYHPWLMLSISIHGIKKPVSKGETVHLSDGSIRQI